MKRSGYNNDYLPVTSHFDSQLNLGASRNARPEKDTAVGYIHPKFKLPLGHLSSEAGKSCGFKIKLQNTDRRGTLDQSLSSIESYSLDSTNNDVGQGLQKDDNQDADKREQPAPKVPKLVLLDTDPHYSKKPSDRTKLRKRPTDGIKPINKMIINKTPIKQSNNPLRQYYTMKKLGAQGNHPLQNTQLLKSAPIQEKEKA